MRYIANFHGILESLRSGARGKVLLLEGAKNGRAPGPRVKEILALAEKLGVEVRMGQKSELDGLNPENRGALLGIEDEKGRDRLVSLDEYLEKDLENGLVLVLDHIEDPQNLGAILRSADAFGADLVVVPLRRASPVSDAVVRSSSGASAWVPVVQVQSLAEAVKKIKRRGYWVYAADMDGDPLPSLTLPRKTCFVLGNEGGGISRLLSESADAVVSIPMRGHVESLNVSVSAAICMYSYRLSREGRPAAEGK